jgi:hypothetical protein
MPRRTSRRRRERRKLVRVDEEQLVATPKPASRTTIRLSWSHQETSGRFGFKPHPFFDAFSSSIHLMPPPPSNVVELASNLQAFIDSNHSFAREHIDTHLRSQIRRFITAEAAHQRSSSKSSSPAFPIEWASRKQQVQTALRHFQQYVDCHPIESTASSSTLSEPPTIPNS